MLNIDLIRKQINMINPDGRFNEPTVRKIVDEAERYARSGATGPDPRIADAGKILRDTLKIIQERKQQEESDHVQQKEGVQL